MQNHFFGLLIMSTKLALLFRECVHDICSTSSSPDCQLSAGKATPNLNLLEKLYIFNHLENMAHIIHFPPESKHKKKNRLF